MATHNDFVVKAGIVAPGSSSFGNNVSVAKDLTVGNNLSVNALSVAQNISSNGLSGNTLNVKVFANVANANIVRFVSANGTIENLGSNTAVIKILSGNVASFANVSASVLVSNEASFGTALVSNTLTVENLVVTGNTSLTIERGNVLRSYREYVSANTPASTYTLDLLDSNVFNLLLTANTTLSVTNLPPANVATSFTLITKQPAGGNARLIWPANTVWSEGIAPTQSFGAAQTDVFTFMVVGSGMIFGAHAFANVS